MRVIAHRGSHRSLPENSIAAFEAAVAIGADGVELDVRLTRDGVPVVIHDLECDHYLESVSGYVFEHTLATLQSEPLRTSPPGSPQRVATLDEVLEAFALRIGLDVELKDPSPELVAAVAASLSAFRDRWSGIVVTSFESAALGALVRTLPASIRTHVLVARSEPWQTPAMLAHRALGKARLAGASAIHLHTSQLNDTVVVSLRDAGLEIQAWDVNDEASFELAERYEVTAFDTDQPERMLELRSRST